MNYSIVETILNRISIGNNLLEIGPGSGILSHCILSKIAPGGCFTMVEKDPRFIPHLQRLLLPLAKKKNITLHIIEGDALEYIIEKPTEIISNIPYNLSSALLYQWLKNNINCLSITVMLQREVGEKLYKPRESNDSYSVLSILAQATGEVRKIMDLSPACFTPAPRVFSQVICYKSYGFSKEQTEELLHILNQAFHNPRKKIINNFNNPVIIAILREMQIDQLRPDQIESAQYAKLAKIYCQKEENSV